MIASSTPHDRSRRRGALPRAAIMVAAALLLGLTDAAVRADEVPDQADGPGHNHAQETPVAQGHGHDHGVADEGPTAVERDAANALVAATRAGTARLVDPAAAMAEGYIQGTSYAFYGLRAAHFYHPDYSQDGVVLDPARPENLVYLKSDDGTLELIGVMYTAPDAGPAVGGPLTAWHAHPDLCSSREGVVLKHADGTCPPGTRSIDVEMLHVWLVDVPGGPFADNPVGELEGPLVGAGDAHNSIVAGTGLVDGEAMLREIGEALGLPPDEIGRRYAAGESLAEMAEAEGIAPATLTDLLEGWLVAEFDRAVARGDMTPEQRDLTVRHLSPQVERMVEIHAGEPWVSGPPAADESA